MQRRQTRLNERLTNCQCCGYPISQKHHLLEVSRFDDNEYTYQLCANCHELYHIIKSSREYGDNSRPMTLFLKITKEWGEDHLILQRMIKLVDLILEVEGKLVAVFEGVDEYKKWVGIREYVTQLVQEEGYTLVPPGYRAKETCQCPICSGNIQDPEITYQTARTKWFNEFGVDLDTHYLLAKPKQTKIYFLPADKFDLK